MRTPDPCRWRGRPPTPLTQLMTNCHVETIPHHNQSQLTSYLEAGRIISDDHFQSQMGLIINKESYGNVSFVLLITTTKKIQQPLSNWKVSIFQ